MDTECTAGQLEFNGLGRRSVVAQFDGGKISSDSGGLLLREVEQRTHILKRLAGCFVDHRDQDQIEHSLESLIKQRVMGLALGYEDLNDHGKSWQAVYDQEHAPGFRWLHESIGTNGRMLEFQAAIGRIQLRRMNEWSTARRQNAKRIREAAAVLPGLRVPDIPSWADHAAYKCYVFVDAAALHDGWSRDRIMAAINERGVPCYSGSCSEIYREKAIYDRGFAPTERLPIAQQLGDTSLMFLVHPTLTNENTDLTCEALASVMTEAAESA